MKQVFANYDTATLNKIDQIDLKNHYIRNKCERLTRCLICEVNIDEHEAFEHAVSSTHRYNKLFYNFVQKRIEVGDLDFITLNRNWVRCRYCDNGRIPNTNEHRLAHIQSRDTHQEKKRYCLNRATGGTGKIAVLQPAAKATDSRIITSAMSGASVSGQRQLAVMPNKLNKMRAEIIDQIQSSRRSEQMQNSSYTVAGGSKNLVNERRATEVQDPRVKTYAQTARGCQEEISSRASYQHRFTAIGNREVNEMRREVPQHYQSFVRGYEVYDSDSNSDSETEEVPQHHQSLDYGYKVHGLDSEAEYYWDSRTVHYSNHTAGFKVEKKSAIPAWVWWVGIGCGMAWIYNKYK